MVIKSVRPISVAKLAGFLYAALGFLIGAVLSLAAMAGAFASDSEGGAMFGAVFGVGAIVLLPLLYGCLGFVFTLIGAWLYNVAAGFVGGIEVEVQ